MSLIDLSNLRPWINDKQFPIFTTDKRFIVCVGSRGSGKSWSVAQKVISNSIRKKCRQLVCHKVNRHIRDTCFKQIQDVIDSIPNLSNYVKTNVSPMGHVFWNGSEILYKGLADVERQKSLPGVSLAWIEELSCCEPHDWDGINALLRGKCDLERFQLIATTNPESNVEWIKEFAEAEANKNNTLYIHSTYKDNKFIDPEYESQFIESIRHNDQLFRKWALGEFVTLEGLVYTDYEVKRLSDDVLENYSVTYGCDQGHTDPTTLFRISHKDPILYIEELIYKPGMTHEQIATEMKSIVGHKKVFIDNSRPELIHACKNKGINALPSKKGKDSVSAGIDFIRTKELVISPDSINCIKDMKNYMHKKVNGKFIEDTEDNFKHSSDTIRYACSELINFNQTPLSIKGFRKQIGA